MENRITMTEEDIMLLINNIFKNNQEKTIGDLAIENDIWVKGNE